MRGVVRRLDGAQGRPVGVMRGSVVVGGCRRLVFHVVGTLAEVVCLYKSRRSSKSMSHLRLRTPKIVLPS